MVREGCVEAGRWKAYINNVGEARMLEWKWERRLKSQIERAVEKGGDRSR